MLARRHIPNLLTYARAASVPVALAIMLTHPSWQAPALFWIFVVASLTDYLDGYLARKWSVVSPIGTMLDPIADKLLVALMLVYLLTVMGTELFLPVTVILLRELYISGLREFLASRQIKLPVSQGGKWKTALQMIAIMSFLYNDAYVYREWLAVVSCPESGCGLNPLGEYSVLLLYLSALLSFTSAVSYTRASLKHLR